MAESDLDTLIERATEHLSASRFPEADTLAREVLRDHKDNDRALHIRGFVALNLNQPAAALEFLKKAEAAGSENPLMFMHLGAALGMNGDRTSAIAAFDKAIQLAPTLTEAHQNKGLAMIGEKRFEEAVFAFEAAEFHGAGAAAKDGRGQALFHLSRFVEAKAAFEAALEMEPENLPALSNLGHTLLALGEPAAALERFEKATRLAPGESALELGLAQARAANGDPKGAKSVLRGLLSRHPGFQPAQDLLARIELGEDRTAKPDNVQH